MSKRSPDESSSSGNGSKRIACMECRQQKVKCDAQEHLPDPCSRCRKKNHECILDASFKRTAKRAKLMALEREMELLKRNLESEGTRSPYHPSPPVATAGPVSKSTPQPIYPAPSHNLPSAAYIPKVQPLTSSSTTNTNTNIHMQSQTHPQPPSHGSPICTTAIGYDSVTLDPPTINHLFARFVQKYHPFLPVVDVSKGPELIHKLCPALFWAIMSIASRRYDRDRQLMMHLTPVLRACMSDIYAISPVSKDGSPNVATVYSVQAFLLCAMWPPLTSMISTDSAWSSAGAAMFSAVRVGLHCPGFARDFARIKETTSALPQIREQMRTWVCCNIVSQAIACMYGFPSFTSFDATVISFQHQDDYDNTYETSVEVDTPSTSSPYALNSASPVGPSGPSHSVGSSNGAMGPSGPSGPSGAGVGSSAPTTFTSIKQMMLITRLEHDIEQTLNSSLRDPLGLSDLSERLSLIQILAHKLDELELTLETTEQLSDYTRLMLLAARVHLLTYYFLDNYAMSSLQREKGLVEGYNSALALLHHCDQVSRTNKDFIRHLPQVYVQAIWQTTAIIVRVCHSRYAPYVDVQTGKNLYFSTVKYLARASILKHDVIYRAAEIMQQTWKVYELLSTQGAASNAENHEKVLSARVAIRTRRSASVFFDCLWTMREEFGIRSVAPSVLNQRLSDDDEESVAKTDDNPPMAARPMPHGHQITTPGSMTDQHAPINTMSKPPEMTVPTPVDLPALDWNMDLAWRDVDFMMTDFGFRAEEAEASLM